MVFAKSGLAGSQGFAAKPCRKGSENNLKGVRSLLRTFNELNVFAVIL